MLKLFLQGSSIIIPAMLCAAPAFAACVDEGDGDIWGVNTATNEGCWIGGTRDPNYCRDDGNGDNFGRRPDTGEYCSLTNSLSKSVSSKPQLTNLSNGATIQSTQVLKFTSNTTVVKDWILRVGSAVAKNNYYDSGILGSNTTQHTLRGLPSGKTVYISLYYRNASRQWVPTYYTAKVAGGGTDPTPTDKPALTNISDGSTIGSNQVLKFSANGATVKNWIIRVGSGQAKNNYYDSGFLAPSINQHTVSGLPSGKSVHISLYHRDSAGKWVGAFYNASVATGGGGGGGSDPGSGTTTTLKKSGPVNVSADNTIVENVDITSTRHDRCAIRVVGRKNITLRNININHAGAGICVYDSENVEIQTVRIVNTINRPGPHCRPGLTVDACKRTSRNKNPERLYPADSHNNIIVKRSTGVSIDTAYVEKGEGGVITVASPGVTINNLHCKDIRGPYWRGQCVMFSEGSHGSRLTNFYAQQFLTTSSGHDNISAFKSHNVVVSNGLVDGNWSRNGVGVIADNGADYMTVKNVDLTHQGTAGINAWSGGKTKDADGNLIPNPDVPQNFTAENVRVRDGHCFGTWYGANIHPSSGGIAFSKHPLSANAVFKNNKYWNHCRSHAVFSSSVKGIVEANFTLKSPPIDIKFPWLK